MLYLCFRPQKEPLDMIEEQLSVMKSIVIEHVTECQQLIMFNHTCTMFFADGIHR